MSENQEALIEIPEEVKVEAKAEYSIEGKDPREIKLAEKHGLIKKDTKNGELQGSTSTSSEKSSTGKEEEKEQEEVKPDFEEVEQKQELLNKYNPNEKALYFKWKSDKKKRQEYQEKFEQLQAKQELDSIKTQDALNRISKAKALLKDPSAELTVEKMLAIIDDVNDDNPDAKPLTLSDLKQIEELKQKEQEKSNSAIKAQQQRYQTTEEIGKSKYENFEQIVNLAGEVAELKPSYKNLLGNAFNDKTIDEDEVVEMIVSIAQLSPKFKDLDSAKAEIKNETVERALKNSSKKSSSASVGGSSSSRTITESSLTVAQASKLSAEQYRKLKPETKKRLLMGIDP